MSTNNESQCYLVQLQFDACIDGDLTETQQQVFLSHLGTCTECAREFRYAQAVQDGLLDLPLLDCSEAAIEQAQHTALHASPAPETAGRGLDKLLTWLLAAPLAVRYAMPVVGIAVIGLLVLSRLQPGEVGAPLALDPPAAPVALPVQYTPAEIAQALEELNLAIDYLNRVSQRTETMVGDRFLLQPLRERLDASFERVRMDADQPPPGDQI